MSEWTSAALIGIAFALGVLVLMVGAAFAELWRIQRLQETQCSQLQRLVEQVANVARNTATGNEILGELVRTQSVVFRTASRQEKRTEYDDYDAFAPSDPKPVSYELNPRDPIEGAQIPGTKI